jgi:hypothetical protein
MAQTLVAPSKPGKECIDRRIDTAIVVSSTL